MKILVICDDFYHSGDIVKAGLSFLPEEYELIFATDMSNFEFSDTTLSCYDAVILAKDNQTSPTNKDGWLTSDIENQFQHYVENGGGLLFMHAGIVICKRSSVLKALAGSEFSHHPEQCTVEHHIKTSHSITDGAAEFSEKDEHYFITLPANDAVIFLESVSEHGVQPAGYTRTQGRGRICVLTPGHNLSVWQNEQYKIIIKNFLNWCAVRM